MPRQARFFLTSRRKFSRPELPGLVQEKSINSNEQNCRFNYFQRRKLCHFRLKRCIISKRSVQKFYIKYHLASLFLCVFACPKISASEGSGAVGLFPSLSPSLAATATHFVAPTRREWGRVQFCRHRQTHSAKNSISTLFSSIQLASRARYPPRNKKK